MGDVYKINTEKITLTDTIANHLVLGLSSHLAIQLSSAVAVQIFQTFPDLTSRQNFLIVVLYKQSCYSGNIWQMGEWLSCL